MRKTFHFLGGLMVAGFLFALPSIAQNPKGPVDGPAVIAAIAPDFPTIARTAHAEGDVVVEVTIASAGADETSKPLSGHPLLQKAAVTAAKKWRFAPANEGSRKVHLVFNFGYIDGDKSDPLYIITFMPPYKVGVVLNSARVPIID